MSAPRRFRELERSMSGTKELGRRSGDFVGAPQELS
jgi:hypothetical protein